MWVNAEPVHQVEQVLRKSDANGHVADRVFEDQVPTDNPGAKLAHRRLSIGVRAAGNRNHGCKFGITHRSESTRDSDQDKGESDGWARAWASKRGGMVDEVFEERGVKDRGRLKLLTGDRSADNGEDSRTNDRADAERSQTQPPK